MSFKIPEGTSKAEYVQDRFTGIAARYDLFNDIVTQGMHRYWKRFLVKKAGMQAGCDALDMCCGTGDITQLLSKKASQSGTVIGLDFSSGMLNTAIQRDRDHQVIFLQGDAMRLPFKERSFDIVTVGYGLRNLVDIRASLREVHRILKPGGRFVSLDMGKVRTPVIRQLFDFYFFKIVPRIGKVIYPGEDLFDYFPASTMSFPSQARLAEIFSEVGFIAVEVFNFYFGSVSVHLGVKES